MTNRGLRSVVLALLLGLAVPALWAAGPYQVLGGPKAFYFGHISYIDPAPGGDPVVLREGSTLPETAVLNLPVGPGDTVRTPSDRRCEIQFDTGTIVRLDVATEVRVQTILARSLSSSEELSVLALDKGRIYVMYKQYSRLEMFQVLTPNAAVKLKHNSVGVLTFAADGTTEVQMAAGRANVLFGPKAELLGDRTVRTGERLIVRPDHQFELAKALEPTSFELWNRDVNAHFEELHKGLTPLPKPVQNMPPAVFYFAQAYGNHYGEWLWDDLYGYVWRPYIDNGRYPWGWSPYYYGSWSYAGGQLFWVPQEPWGWIPYHLGIWQWDKKLGWVWLPGSMFSPAWVAWDFYFGYASWRPWSLFDWMFGYDMGYSGFGNNYGNIFYRPIWATGDGPSDRLVMPRTVVSKDSLKQPKPGSMPVPSGLQAAVKRVAAAYENGEARVRENASAAGRGLVIVSKSDLTAPAVHEKALTLDQLSKREAGPAEGRAAAPARVMDPRREAVRVFRGPEGQAAAPRRVADPEMVSRPGPGRTVTMTPAPKPAP
ncbi:MAG TPA: DUF6600 domain-containing protein, partial [Candidatus Bathyarchaeia archaeon]|nr:DUF6600 domain-containing protein [Candidatus Bathyarchaeia archaeon]